MNLPTASSIPVSSVMQSKNLTPPQIPKKSIFCHLKTASLDIISILRVFYHWAKKILARSGSVSRKCWYLIPERGFRYVSCSESGICGLRGVLKRMLQIHWCMRRIPWCGMVERCIRYRAAFSWPHNKESLKHLIVGMDSSGIFIQREFNCSYLSNYIFYWYLRGKLDEFPVLITSS